MANQFAYTPREGKEAIAASEQSVIDFNQVEEFDSITDVFDAMMGGLSPYKKKEDDGTVPPSVCLSLFGSLQYEKIEALRRSDEWHAAVDNYIESTEGVDVKKANRMKMKQERRADHATNGVRGVKVPTQPLPDGKVLAVDKENPEDTGLLEATTSVNRAGDVMTVTAKFAIRDLTEEEKKSSRTKAVIEAELEEERKVNEEKKAELEAKQAYIAELEAKLGMSETSDDETSA